MGVAPHYSYSIDPYMLLYFANHGLVFVMCVYRRIVLHVKEHGVSGDECVMHIKN